jgi:hypothetical protein
VKAAADADAEIGLAPVAEWVNQELALGLVALLNEWADGVAVLAEK